MNQYEICREVIAAGGAVSVDGLMGRTGLSERNLAAHLSTLCGQGVLMRERDVIKVKNNTKARELAQLSDTPPKGSMLAQVTPIVAKRQKIELPKGATIFDAVPIPERRIGAIKRPIVLPFAQMKIGQCVLLEIPDGIASTEMANRARAEVGAYQRRFDDKFFATVRATVFPEGHKAFGEPCIGVWRVKADDVVKTRGNAKPVGKKALSAVK